VEGIHRISKDGALPSTMSGQIALPVTVDIALAYHSTIRGRGFPDPSSDTLAIPHHVARKIDIH